MLSLSRNLKDYKKNKPNSKTITMLNEYFLKE